MFSKSLFLIISYPLLLTISLYFIVTLRAVILRKNFTLFLYIYKTYLSSSQCQIREGKLYLGRLSGAKFPNFFFLYLDPI